MPRCFAGLLIAGCAASATGCAGLGRVGDVDGDADPFGPPPPGVSVSLHQFRVDQVARRLLVGVRNDGPAPIYIKDLRLDSASFSTIPPTPIEQALPPTPRIDLPIPFGPARCTTTSIPDLRPAAIVARLGEDKRHIRKVRFPLPHPEPLLSRTLTRECGTHLLRQSINARFGVTWTPAEASEGRGGDAERGERKVLRGDLLITRTGRGRPVTIVSLGANPHVNLRPAGWTTPYPVPAGTGDLALPVEITPARCDPHGFAEAKYAERFALYAEIGDGRRHTLPFEATGGVRTAFDAFVRTACGVPSG